MTMVSFRVDEVVTADLQRWADALGIDRSEFLRRAVRRYVTSLESERDVERWLETPATSDEIALAEVANWGPSEDWSDWSNAAG